MSQAAGLPAGPRDTATRVEDAAIALVRRQGWAATSIDQICRAAGVTKGAFFHHFDSKEDLGVAAAHRWGETTGALFRSADYHQIEDPLQRMLAYLDLRARLAEGPLEAITCFAGTTLQETFATSERLRVACAQTIDAHVEMLAADFRQAIAQYPPREPVCAEDLALHVQAVLQGAFVIAKARADTSPVQAALAHLRRYLLQLFGAPGASGDNHDDKEQ